MNLRTDSRTKLCLLLVGLIFMELLDSTIMNTALPSIAKNLMVSSLSLRTAIASYLIALAIFTPISSYIANQLGIRNTLLLAILIFSISSIFCGTANSEYQLSMFRGVQGVGAALLTPVARLILFKIYKPDELLIVTSYVTIPILFGPILGPLIGGFITTYLSWHWVFFVNIPIGIILGYLVIKLIPNFEKEPETKFSWFEFSLIGIGFASINFALENLNSPKTHSINLLILGLVVLICYLILYHRFTQQILRLNLLKNKNFRIAMFQMLITMGALSGISFLWPVILQKQYLLNPWHSGLLTAPIAFGALIIKPFQTTIYKIIPIDKMQIINPLLLALSLSLFCFIDKKLNIPYLLLIELIYGILFSIQINLNSVSGFLNLDPKDKSAASSFQSTVLLFSMSLSVGIAGIIFAYFLDNSHSTLGNPLATKQVLNSFHSSMLTFGLIAASASLIAYMDNLLCNKRLILPN